MTSSKGSKVRGKHAQREQPRRIRHCFGTVPSMNRGLFCNSCELICQKVQSCNRSAASSYQSAARFIYRHTVCGSSLSLHTCGTSGITHSQLTRSHCFTSQTTTSRINFVGALLLSSQPGLRRLMKHGQTQGICLINLCKEDDTFEGMEMPEAPSINAA